MIRVRSLTAAGAGLLLAAALPRSTPAYAHKTFRRAKDLVVQRWERSYVEDLIRVAGGNLSLAARYGGITRAHLYRLMKKHRIAKPE